MIRKSHLFALALTTAAVAFAAPIAQATAPAGVVADPKDAASGSASGPQVDPLAVTYLIGQGYTPEQIEAWTVGACSHEAKPAACFGASKGANLTDGRVKVDPLAVSSLTGLGLSPIEVTSWTAGACSHEVKAASCYAMLDRAAVGAAPTQVARSIGFQWGDAGIGAGFAFGIVLVLGGAGAGLLVSRQNRRRHMARA
jgi:hypothetical protein